MKIVFGLLLAIVVFTAGEPVVAGYITHRDFKQFVASTNARSGLHIQITNYHQHWFSSDATTAISGLDGTRVATLDHHFYHALNPHFDLAQITTTWTPHSRPFDTLFDGPAVTVTSRFGLGGGVSGRIISPSANGTIKNAKGQPGDIT